MVSDRDNINWQPLSFLPQLAYMIDGMLESAQDTYGPFSQIEDKTVEKVLGKSDAEIGLDFLMGVLKL